VVKSMKMDFKIVYTNIVSLILFNAVYFAGAFT